MTIRTHYDNLQITQEASPEDIRLAYRRLSKKYHPDLNRDPDAHRIMQMINEAYAVLSDPARRAEHDRWIISQKQPVIQITIQQPAPTGAAAAQSVPFVPAPNKKLQTVMLTAALLLLGLLVWQVWYIWQEQRQPDPQQPAVSPAAAILADGGSASAIGAARPLPDASDATVEAASGVLAAPLGITVNTNPTDEPYIQPTAAPNGSPWPRDSNYVEGYPLVLGTGGYRLYVENIRNSSDVFAELLSKKQTAPLRTFFIKERSQIIIDKLDAGEYTVRYRQLDSGETVSSEIIKLEGKQKENTLYLQRSKAPQGF